MGAGRCGNIVLYKLLNSNNYHHHHHHHDRHLTAIGLTPGGSSIHLHTNSTQKTEGRTHITITRGEKKQLQEKKLRSKFKMTILFDNLGLAIR
jgi:hypothetical protein